MKKILLLFLLSYFTISCQDYGQLKVIASLPDSLSEVSGLHKFTNSPLVWIIADSGNEPAVYGYNIRSGNMDKVINISNGKNIDWEDLTGDTEGNLYIGDFGNNNNKRKNLTIYKITKASTFPEGIVKTEAVKTTFYFEDQKKFPPKKKDRNFDVEAFFFLNGNFYLFTRNRSKDFDGTTKLYKVPALEGNYEAELLGEYKTCDDDDECQVTAAAIDFKTGTIALLSSKNIWLFSNYKNDDFFKGDIKRIKLSYPSQKESITFKDSETLYIADELVHMEGGNLYELGIKN